MGWLHTHHPLLAAARLKVPHAAQLPKQSKRNAVEPCSRAARTAAAAARPQNQTPSNATRITQRALRAPRSAAAGPLLLPVDKA